MKQLVQAVCPGCEKLLTIPAEWAGQMIRCKKCSAVMKPKAGPPRATPVPPSRPTPPPLPRQTAPAIPIAAPVAAPVTEPDPTPRRRPVQRGSGVGSWIALGVLAAVFIGGGIAVAVNFKRIQQFAANLDKPPHDGGPVARPKTPTTAPKDKGKVAVGKAGFPRRALVISVHNYLYANPITTGSAGTPDVTRLINALGNGLNVPLTQVMHLSDHSKTPRPPLKPVIQEAVGNFLATTRKQDRILLFWIGHTKEIEGKPYLVPLEGEFDNAETLIPLSWLLDQLAKCECRQKVLVIDGNRHNLAQGEERPVPGAMGEAFAKALEAAPPGVQVWSACGKEQESNEVEDYPLGIFLDSLRQALSPEEGKKGALEGKIQSPDEPIPVEVLHKAVASVTEATAKARELKQTPLLFGKEPEGGPEYDATEVAAKTPALPVVATANQAFVRQLLDEISLPSLKGGGESAGSDLSFANLPPFPPEDIKKFDGTLPGDAPLRQAVAKARATLWAISTATAPSELTADVQAMRTKLRVDLSIMADRYSRPGGGPAEQTFKNSFEGKSRDMSRIVAVLERSLEELEEAKPMRDAEETPPRWRAHYDYTVARFKAQLAFLEEYNGLLGAMRKDLPPIEAVHSGWRMSAKEKPGDSIGKKLEKAARKHYGQLVEENPKTPWEVLGKREKLNALGLEWQAY